MDLRTELLSIDSSDISDHLEENNFIKGSRVNTKNLVESSLYPGTKDYPKIMRRLINLCSISSTDYEKQVNNRSIIYLLSIKDTIKVIEKYKEDNLVCGFGINDLKFNNKMNPELALSNARLMRIIERCYGDRNKYKSYQGCTISEEWRLFSNFNKWFQENYVDGYVVDKDLLSGDFKTYSKETCVFVPVEINNLIISPNEDSELPMGVFYRKDRDKYQAKLSKMGSNVFLGYFDDPIDAFYRYKEEKEKHLKFVAKKYFSKNLIYQRGYCKLLNYNDKTKKGPISFGPF